MNFFRLSPLLLGWLLWLGSSPVAPAQSSGKSIDELAADLTSGDRNTRREAAYRIHQLGAQAQPAVPALIKALGDSDQQVWFLAVMTLSDIGPGAKDAVPALMKGLESGGGRRRRGEYSQSWYRTSFALGRIGTAALPALIEGLGHDRPQVRSGSAKAITWIGPEAKDAIPPLIKNLSDNADEVWDQSIEALGAVGPSAMSELLKTVASEEKRSRQGAVQALGWMEDAASEAAPALLAACAKESDPEVRADMLQALGRIDCAPADLLPLLLDGMQAADETLQHESINGLLLLPQPKTLAVPALLELLKSNQAAARERAATVLGRIGPEAIQAVPDLVRLAAASQIPQSDSETSSVFVRSLIDIGAPTVPSILQALESQDPSQITDGHWTIASLKEMGEPALAPLIQATQSPAFSVRLGATAALKSMGPDARKARPALSQLLRDPEPRVRAAALLAVVAVGTEVKDLVPQLTSAMNDESPLVRRSAVQVLAEAGPEAALALSSLIQALQDSDAEVRTGATRALGAIGSEAKPAVELLSKQLLAAGPALQTTIIQTLGDIGPAAAPAVPALMGLLENPSWEIRAAALQCLGHIGPEAREARPALQKACAHSDSNMRSAALTALSRIETNRQLLLPALINGLKDPSSDVRHPAAEAVGKMGQDGRPASAELCRMLKDEEDWSLAIDTLRLIRVDSIPLLVEALSLPEPSVRLFACETLGRLGPPAKEALPQLRKLLEDRYELIRRQAREAINRLEDS